MTPKEIVQIATDNNEPEWFIKKRLKAFSMIEELSFPKIQRFDFHNWELMSEDLKICPNKSNKQENYFLLDLFEASRRFPSLVKQYYMSTIVPIEESKLTAYHAAFLNNGLFLYVPDNTVVKEPIELELFQNNKTFVSHILIIAGENSQFSFIQKMSTSNNERSIANCIVEIMAKENSFVKYAAVDELGKNVTTYLVRKAHLESNAYVDWSIGLMNSGNTIADFNSDLHGEGSHSEIKVVDITKDNQQEVVNTRVTNYGKHSIGNINQRGVIMDRSRLTFNGIGHIIHGASGANAEQQNKVLMMSSEAHGDANPILLIDENDVLAGHAASVGQVDEQQLYYLMSRGIDKKMAQRMVVRGFLGDVLISIPSKGIREQLVKTIERKLADGSAISENS